MTGFTFCDIGELVYDASTDTLEVRYREVFAAPTENEILADRAEDDHYRDAHEFDDPDLARDAAEEYDQGGD